MAREDQHFRLRIPDDLKQRVEAAASANHRSMTAEIVARLIWALPGGGADEQLLELAGERDRLDAELKKLEKLTERVAEHLRMANAEATGLYYDDAEVVKEARAANTILAALVEANAIADPEARKMLSAAFAAPADSDRQEMLAKYARVLKERRAARSGYAEASEIVEKLKAYFASKKPTKSKK